jgi:hypothetical protein
MHDMNVAAPTLEQARRQLPEHDGGRVEEDGGARWRLEVGRTEAGGRQSTSAFGSTLHSRGLCGVLGMANGHADPLRTCSVFSVQVQKVQELELAPHSSVSAATAAAGSGQGSNERPRAARDTRLRRRAVRRVTRDVMLCDTRDA